MHNIFGIERLFQDRNHSGFEFLSSMMYRFMNVVDRLGSGLSLILSLVGAELVKETLFLCAGLWIWYVV